MKSISIVTGSDLRQIQGVNYFIKSFLECNRLFLDVKVDRVYSSMQTLKVDNGDKMPIGADSGTREYVVRTGVRTFLRKLLTDKFYPFALLRYELNFYHNAYYSVNNFFNDAHHTDYIVFQEIGCAYYYFKKLKKKNIEHKPKTTLVIHSEDDSGSMLINSFNGFGKKDMQRRYNKRRDFVYSHIDKVIYISHKAYNHSILPVSKRAIIYNGCPNFDYSFNKSNHDLVKFVCVGSFAGRKGQDKIVEALKLLPVETLKKLHVTLVGDGTELENIRTYINNNDLDNYVTLTGRRNDVPEILKEMDVFIMPSLVEGLPMSAIEAMRAGLFLILTDTGGNVELCSDGCGFICNRNPEDIMRKIQQIIDSGVVSNEQKKHSRKRFLQNFSLESMAQGYESTLKCI